MTIIFQCAKTKEQFIYRGVYIWEVVGDGKLHSRIKVHNEYGDRFTKEIYDAVPVLILAD